ncbi:helix-turn-helix transcriptional regulator [Noviherbaspirillum album]|uniref:helix-turn-helix transcriptional regulator n=1 Tax=Noviherbaspirillum album TaxID=3080276 RepID=UPI003460FA8F
MPSNHSIHCATAPPTLSALPDVSLPAEVHAIIRKAWAAQHDYVLRLPELTRTCGRASSTVWQDIKQRRFPPPFPLGARAVGWKASEVRAWLEVRAFAARSSQKVDMQAFVTLLTSMPSP